MQRPLRVAELCAGYGGLYLSLQAAGLQAELVWYAENDPSASTVLAAHHPGVPNVGDITAVDWRSLDPVDILAAGYPCQDLSNAGKRAGIEGDKSRVWHNVADAVRDLRPGIVLLENVAGHLARGFGRVLGDLASLGYDAQWTCLRASDLGAPHQRDRLFVYAYPRGTGGGGATGERILPEPGPGDLASGIDSGVGLLPTPGARLGDGRGAPNGDLAAARYAAGRRNLDDAVALLPTPAASDGQGGPRDVPTVRTHSGPDHGPRLRDVAPLLPTPTASDGSSGPGHATSAQGSPDLRTTIQLLPTPAARDGDHGAGYADVEGRPLSETVMRFLPTPKATDGEKGGPNQRGSAGDLTLPSAVQPGRWGRYEAAISRWERLTGSPAPDPTAPGRSGQPRLSPRFVEWMMGLPAGYVTDHLDRNAALRVLGNGVVPVQAAAAYRALMQVV